MIKTLHYLILPPPHLKSNSLEFFSKINTIQWAPAAISVTLQGKRRELQQLNLNHVSAHIDASALKTPVTYTIQILPEHIFLHNYLKLMNYLPVVTQIELTKIENPGTE